jgi:hypothetical protein
MIPNRVVWSAITIVVVSLAFVFYYSTINKLNFSEMMALAQVVFNILAFAAILYTLYYASGQFRKSMAKPLIEVAFNEKGEQQATLIYKDGKLEAGLPHPWLINKGNAVARYFQINFIIPENIGNPSVSNYLYTLMYISFVKANSDYILSYTNEGRYTLFVNRPYSDPNMIFGAAIDTKKCIEVYKDSFEIKYRIYGDWAETQEGKLKVNIHKQQEAT